MKEITLKGLSAKERDATLNEVRVLKKLSHPHVVAYKDSHSLGETLNICMEYAAGGDLAGRIAAKQSVGTRFEEAAVLRIAYQLSSALAYCHHDVKMLHRDLKPQNVFLSARGDVKLGDFGLSKALAASAALAVTQCGTPLYMSPELCEGKPYDRGVRTAAANKPGPARRGGSRMGLHQGLGLCTHSPGRRQKGIHS
eukprot:6504977-Prymnesium_polylepis.2